MQRIKPLIFFLILFAGPLGAAELRVAVASNFLPTLLQLKPQFETWSGHQLLISSASTGQIYAQLRHAAPFDVFMAADVNRPEQLVTDGLATELVVYARGQLMLISNASDVQPCEHILQSDQLKYLAMANPDLAPYGAAAKQFLQHNEQWYGLNGKRVLGENVAQALQLVISKNATAGLVAQSLLSAHELSASQCTWPVPTAQHEPIDQAMVFITASDKKAIFDEFKAFLQTAQSQSTLSNNGYAVPGIK